MRQQSRDPDPRAHVREQVRRILDDEDRACLGVKVRPPIPVSPEESVALERLRHLNSATFDPKPPASSGSSE